MLYLDSKSKNIIEARDYHYEAVKERIDKGSKKWDSDILSFIKNNLETLITGTPKELEELNEKFFKEIKSEFFKEIEIVAEAVDISSFLTKIKEIIENKNKELKKIEEELKNLIEELASLKDKLKDKDFFNLKKIGFIKKEAKDFIALKKNTKKLDDFFSSLDKANISLFLTEFGNSLSSKKNTLDGSEIIKLAKNINFLDTYIKGGCIKKILIKRSTSNKKKLKKVLEFLLAKETKAFSEKNSAVLNKINELITKKKELRDINSFYKECRNEDSEEESGEKEKINIKRLFKFYLKSEIEKIINYKDWRGGDHAYQVAKLINQNTCTYCNRLYTSSFTKGSKKVFLAQFDHWFPKADYPLLALSFYNLIPSCSPCNSSVKGSVKFALDTHIHPYVDDIINDFSFGYDLKAVGEYKIKIETKEDKIKKTLDDFKIKEIYNSHQSELDDLITTKRAYSKGYLSSLALAFPKAGLSDKDIYRLAFGVEQDEKDFHKHPLSKFKHDILEELKLIP